MFSNIATGLFNYTTEVITLVILIFKLRQAKTITGWLPEHAASVSFLAAVHPSLRTPFVVTLATSLAAFRPGDAPRSAL